MLDQKIFWVCLLVPLAWGASLHDVGVGDDNSLAGRDQVIASLKSIQERLDRWDEFYMGRLEPRMVGAATSLANLDSNIRNLQERAHVWDTFQLHVSAWNDQIKALDQKMNIINEGYEKLQALDSALYSALKQNGSLHIIELQLARLDEKVDNIGQGLTRDVNTPIVSEFASRGVLHTLKIVERKLDRIQMAVDRTGRSGEHEDVEEVRCLTPVDMQDLLRDVSSKVDSIFDRNDESQIELSNDVSETRHGGRACKRLGADQRKLLGRVEYLKNVVQELIGEEPVNGEKSQALRSRRRLRDLDEVKDTLEDIERGISNLGRQQDRNINENEKILRRLEKKIDAVTKDDENDDDLVINRLKRLEKYIKKALEKATDDDDDDDDTDENDNDESKRGKKSRKNDTDEDDDDDDSDEKPKKKSKNDSDDDDDDDSDEKPKKKSKNDSDDDDDDDSDEKPKKKSKNVSDDDENDDDSDDDEKRSKDKDDDTDEDEDDNDTKEDDDDDDDEDDSDSKRKRKDNDDDDDDDDDSDEDNRRSKIQKKVDKRQTDAPVAVPVVEKKTEEVEGAAHMKEGSDLSGLVDQYIGYLNLQ